MAKHETHTACNPRIKAMGGEAQCCYCVPHGLCDLNPEALPSNNGQGVSEAPLPSVEANTESFENVAVDVLRLAGDMNPDYSIDRLLEAYRLAIQAAKEETLAEVRSVNDNLAKAHQQDIVSAKVELLEELKKQSTELYQYDEGGNPLVYWTLIDTELSKLRSGNE